MTQRPRPGATAVQPFDDRRTSHAIGAMATAFVVGGVAAWFAMGAARSATRARLAGPADGAPLMRAPLQVVAPVDLQRYAGIWHEQARLPNRFQKQCAGPVSAEYTPQPDGTVQVVNRCVREDGNFDEAVGTARVVPVAGQPGAGRLEVRFAPAWLSWLPLVWGDYWILGLADDYSWAVVGSPDRAYLWILARTSTLETARLDAARAAARANGFDTDRLAMTHHTSTSAR